MKITHSDTSPAPAEHSRTETHAGTESHKGTESHTGTGTRRGAVTNTGLKAHTATAHKGPRTGAASDAVEM